MPEQPCAGALAWEGIMTAQRKTHVGWPPARRRRRRPATGPVPLLTSITGPPTAPVPRLDFGVPAGQLSPPELAAEPQAPPRPPPAAPALDPLTVRQSLEGMTAGAKECAGDFYGYLFTVCPHLREMFPPQMNMQNERLFAALLKIAALIDQPDALGRYLGQLGADHRKYGVKPEHYAPVGDALLRTLRRHCPDWGEKQEEAWASAYATASQMMISGAAAAPGPATWKGRVVRHERRTPDLAVLTVATDVPVAYFPGQYVTVESPRWPRCWRQFSVANMPGPDGTNDHLDLHVRAVRAGWVSSALVRHTRLNSSLTIGPPAGALASAALWNHDLVMVAGGTGLAPVKAVIEAVLAHDEAAVAAGSGQRRNIHLFHGARTPLDLYDMPALYELSACYPGLQVVPVVSDTPGYPGLTGNVADAVLNFSQWPGHEIFISGPPEMTRQAVARFRESGYPESLLHFESETRDG
jgi:NAD(P)H-flavin reductase/hemoglobin-like flavoprotein